LRKSGPGACINIGALVLGSGARGKGQSNCGADNAAHHGSTR